MTLNYQDNLYQCCQQTTDEGLLYAAVSECCYSLNIEVHLLTILQESFYPDKPTLFFSLEGHYHSFDFYLLHNLHYQSYYLYINGQFITHLNSFQAIFNGLQAYQKSKMISGSGEKMPLLT